jgi:hypothetical protein
MAQRAGVAVTTVAIEQPAAARAWQTVDDGRERRWASGDLDPEVGEQIAHLLSVCARPGHQRRL